MNEKNLIRKNFLGGFTPLESNPLQNNNGNKKKYSNYLISRMNYLVRKLSLTGFTIVEMLTVLVIVIIIGYSISLLMTQVINSYTKIKSEQEIVDTSRTIIRLLMNDLENAYISKLDNRFAFVGARTSIDFNAFLETSIGETNVVEIGYFRNANNQLIRRLEENNIPNLLTSGGTSSIVADNVQTLQFRFCYKDATGNFQYTSANWDSRIEHFANYNNRGENKDPDGLPEAVEVSFSLQDSKAIYPVRSFTTKIYLPQDKY